TFHFFLMPSVNPFTRLKLSGTSLLPPGNAATTLNPARSPSFFGSLKRSVKAGTCEVSQPIMPILMSGLGSSAADGEGMAINPKKARRRVAVFTAGSFHAIFVGPSATAGIIAGRNSPRQKFPRKPSHETSLAGHAVCVHHCGLAQSPRRPSTALEGRRREGRHHARKTPVDVRLRRPHPAGRGGGDRAGGQNPCARRRQGQKGGARDTRSGRHRP